MTHQERMFQPAPHDPTDYSHPIEHVAVPANPTEALDAANRGDIDWMSYAQHHGQRGPLNEAPAADKPAINPALLESGHAPVDQQ